MEFFPLGDDCEPNSTEGIVPPIGVQNTSLCLMGLSLLGDDCRPTLLMGLIPTKSPAKFIAPLMEFFSLGDDWEPNSTAEIFPTRSLKFGGIADGISPTREQQHKLTKAIHVQPTIPEIEISARET